MGKRDIQKLQDRLEQSEAELRRVMRERDNFQVDMESRSKNKDNDIEKLELEITQLNTERDQLVRQLEKSQDMLLTFQQDLNMAENDLKHVTNENRRLKEEAGATEKGIFESKEREIRTLSEKIRTMENEYDDLLQKEGKEKLKADRAEREIIQLEQKINRLETDLMKANMDNNSRQAMAASDTSKFDIEITRLTKERDLAKTELDVCRHDLSKVESDLKKVKEERDKLDRDNREFEIKLSMNGPKKASLEKELDKSKDMEKGMKETLESKDNEIKKLKDTVSKLETDIKNLEGDIQKLKSE